MTIDEMIELKKENGYAYAMIAEETGIPLSTLQKVFSKQTKSPRYETIHLLTAFFNKHCHKYQVSHVAETSSYRETKHQGEYTLEDYYAIPDDQRVELIDGVIYDMSAPTWAHQGIVGEVFRQISNYIHEKKGKCIARISPIDVQLDQDNKTMIQPDVLITCKPDIITDQCLRGAPDWIMEVLSPTTKSKDSIKKLNKYLDAGVREFWIVDSEEQTVTVYDFEHDRYPIHYTFHDQIPIMIYDGDLKIDMTEVK